MDVIDPYGLGTYNPSRGALRNKHALASEWASSNYVLDEGEIGVEVDTDRFKMGDGETPWNDLGYFASENYVAAMIAQAVISSAADAAASALGSHINSSTPHPVYDDGPSLTLLYENAKV